MYFFGIEILLGVSRHVFGKSKSFHAARYGSLHDFFELVFCVTGTELPRVTVHGESHDEMRFMERVEC